MARIPIVSVLVLSLSMTELTAQSLFIYCEYDNPLQFRNPDGSLTGMSVEIVQEIQRRIGNRDPILMVPWARGLRELESNPNTFLFSMARTADRNPNYQWIGPIDENHYCFYVRHDSKIRLGSLDDAKKVGSIGVYGEDVRDQFLTKAGFTNLVRSYDNIVNLKQMMVGNLDMYAGTLKGIKAETAEAGYALSDIKSVFVFLEAQQYIAVSKNTQKSVVAEWKNALADMKADGKYKKIFRKYYPDRELPGPEKN